MKTNVITFVAIIGFALWLALHMTSIVWTPVRAGGAVIAAIGLLLVLTARIQLGRSFSVSAQARKLVTTGLYSRIRNPIYVFSATFLAGVAIAIGRPMLLLILVALVPLQIRRAHNEEQVLTEAFGEEYVRYKAQTWF
jgi:protein-S-isoprenylcysteine O-methyltransferase Ste14